MTTTEILADGLSKIHLGEVDKKLIIDTRYCLLDALGCGLFGSTKSESKKIVSVFSEFDHKGGSPVWGTAYSFSPDNTALICGTFCHMRELDDVHYAIIHPGAVCVPAAFSVAHHKQKTLGDLLVAILCGLEAMIRISKGINYLEHSRRGWHVTATCGSFGAAVAASKLLGLDSKQMSNAIGLAGSRTGGTHAYMTDDAMSKRLHPGLASRDGVLSAYLAAVGITGPSYILESERGGFYKLTSSNWELNHVIENIGEKWAIGEIEYKWYASCKSVHSPLEASIKIYNEIRGRKKIEDVMKIIVEVGHSGLDAKKMYDPQSTVSAQLSIPYGIALGLLGRSGGFSNYSNDCLEDPNIYVLAKKVEVKLNEEFDLLRIKEHKSGSRVTVFWKDGTTSTCMVDSPKGSIGQPLNKKDMEDKFIDLSGRVLGKDSIKQIRNMIIDAPVNLPVRNISKLLKI